MSYPHKHVTDPRILIHRDQVDPLDQKEQSENVEIRLEKFYIHLLCFTLATFNITRNYDIKCRQVFDQTTVFASFVFYI